jgi:hypothetical protein
MDHHTREWREAEERIMDLGTGEGDSGRSLRSYLPYALKRFLNTYVSIR